MKTITKKDLHLIGSASNIESLKDLILQKLYWSRVDVSESIEYYSKLGKCFSVGNANGILPHYLIVDNGRRAGLYRFINH